MNKSFLFYDDIIFKISYNIIEATSPSKKDVIINFTQLIINGKSLFKLKFIIKINN